jgi:hypothetical protein
MLDLVFEGLFGWILELLPFDISSSRRARLYTKGARVYIQAIVSGVPGSSNSPFVALERGSLWLARRKGAPELEMVPIPLPSDPRALEISERVTWSQDRFVGYEVANNRIQISCKYDWDLLRLAVSEGVARQMSPD